MTALALAGADGDGVARPDSILPPGFDRLGEVVRFKQEPAPAPPARSGPLALALAPAPEPQADRDLKPANDVDESLLPTQLLILARRSGDRCDGRSVTLPNRNLTRAERRSGQLTVYPDVERPTTRGECEGQPRPCPWISCRHHLFLDVDPVSGAAKFHFPGKEPWQLAETCSLDVADRGGVTLEKIGELCNLTRERARQVEVAGLERARKRNLGAAKMLDGRG